MTLEDLDWERGEIVVRGKGQRLERLPLPADVGAALACYLCEVRPACATRRVFIRMKAPQQVLQAPSRSAASFGARFGAPDWTRSSRERTCCGTRLPPICFAAARR